MTLRRDGVDVDPCRLAEAYPEATPRLVVFVHGLGQTDDAWRRRHVPYGFRLQVELGYTPLYIRYNSGRHISENGRELAALLDAVVSGWPVAVDAIALIGHSVGGLVARSACHYGAGLAWAGRLRQVVSLGAPHGGAPLERVTAAAGAVLTRLPETRPVAGLLEARSAGIKDLRDPHEVPFLATADYYFVSAGAPVGRDSAWAHPAPGEPMRFPVDHYREVHGIGYFDLLDHPAVYAVIREWLGGGRPALPAPPASLPPGQRP
jgi:pimeloyl-ACP methyl ester carboxylesterase